MIAVIQRVLSASVSVLEDPSQKREIGPGCLVFIGVSVTDTEKDADFMANKIPALRIFENKEGKMSDSVTDINGAILIVPQFTLLGDTDKGHRPDFYQAASPATAEPLFEQVFQRIKARHPATEKGYFRRHMLVSLVNDGPVTLIVNSRKDIDGKK